MSIFRRRKRPSVVDFQLGNGEERHAEAPRIFFIPSLRERQSLEVGDLAKLMFEIVDPTGDMPGAERMWVEVTAVTGTGYVGRLDSNPIAITTIAPDDLIEFGPEHVIQLFGGDPRLDKRVFLSRRSHTEDLRPAYVYREEPDHEGDSGWRAFVGDESDEEVNDPDNILVQNLGFLVDRWPELEPLITADPVEGEWEWSDESQAYGEVPGDRRHVGE